MKAVIFDVDGTLVDSVDVHAHAWQDAFHEFGKDIDFAAIRGQIGKGSDQLMPVFLNRAELDAKGEAIDKRRAAILKESYLDTIKPFPKVRELFERILGDGKRVVLASSAKKEELGHYKRLAKIDDLIEDETSSDDAERSKPHPDIFEAALRRLGDVAPQDALVVGDTPYDAQASRKAGVSVVGVLCGGFPEASLRQAGCIAIYRDPADLLARYADTPLAG